MKSKAERPEGELFKEVLPVSADGSMVSECMI